MSHENTQEKEDSQSMAMNVANQPSFTSQTDDEFNQQLVELRQLSRKAGIKFGDFV